MTYISFTKWIQVQLENVISEVFPAWVELASDEPDAVWAETLVVDTELDSLGPAHTSGSTTHMSRLLSFLGLVQNLIPILFYDFRGLNSPKG